MTVSLLTDHFADYSGHLGDQPGVRLHNADGRNYLARSDKKYDLIWYVAPDSYAVSNAASSGAFVLSESYLYTSEMIAESLRHLTSNGIMVVQFGELDFTHSPNRTARYLMTARDAFAKLGIDNPAKHLIVAAYLTHKQRRPVDHHPQAHADHAGRGRPLHGGAARRAAGRQLVRARAAAGTGHRARAGRRPTRRRADAVAAAYPRQISAVTDDKPFFWHFVGFGTVLRHIFTPLDAHNPEDVIGERVLLLLLAVAILFAAVFLLAPFFFVRKEWRRLPSKGVSAVYFAALGLGFMFFEITMIQRLVRFLGYPTYSLTVTLASILVFTGLGALLSKRFAARARPGASRSVRGARSRSRCFYVFALDGVTDSLLTSALGVRDRRDAAAPRAARAVPRHVHAARSRPGRRAERARRRVRRVVVGGQRVLLGDRVGAHDDPGDDVRLPDSCSSSRSSSTRSRRSRSGGCTPSPAREPDEPAPRRAWVPA